MWWPASTICLVKLWPPGGEISTGDCRGSVGLQACQLLWEAPVHYGQHHSLGRWSWTVGEQREGAEHQQSSQEHTCTHSPPSCGHDAASSLKLLSSFFPLHDRLEPGTMSQIKLFSHKLPFVGYFVTETEMTLEHKGIWNNTFSSGTTLGLCKLSFWLSSAFSLSFQPNKTQMQKAHKTGIKISEVL